MQFLYHRMRLEDWLAQEMGWEHSLQGVPAVSKQCLEPCLGVPNKAQSPDILAR